MAENLESVLDFDGDPIQRVKRSEVLLAQLYHQEIDPPFRASPPRALRALIVASSAAVLIFTGTLFYKFNNFVFLREDVLTRQGNMEAALQRRFNLFGNLVKLTLNHAALEHAIFSHTAEMRTEIIQKSGLSKKLAEALKTNAATARPNGENRSVAPKDKSKSVDPIGKAASLLGPAWTEALGSLRDGGLGAPLGRLLAVVEQYPNIQSSETYKQLMTSLVDMEDRISVRREEYNTSMRQYNTAISKFPWKLLARTTNFDRLQYFSSGGSREVPPIISPDIYQQLVPLVATKATQQ